MKNEGWGIKEDQIPSSSHYSHQTMGSHLNIYTSEKYLSQLTKRLVAFSKARHSFACLVEGYFLRFALCLALVLVTKTNI